MFGKLAINKLFIFIVIMITMIVNSTEEECNASMERKIDSDMAKLMTIGNSGRKFPEDKEGQLKKYCDDSANYISQVDNYQKKCLKDLPKQVTGVISYSIKNSINQLCRKDSKRLDVLIDSAKCSNKGSHELSKCYSKYIDEILGAKHAEDKKKIPHVCCAYYRVFTCYATKARKIEACTESRLDVSVGFFKSLFGNVMDLMCADYTEGSDKCDNLERTPRKKKNQRRTKSFLIPLIDLLSSFPQL